MCSICRGINIYSSPPHPKIHAKTQGLAAFRSFSRSHDGAHIALDQMIRRIINQTSHAVALLEAARERHDVLDLARGINIYSSLPRPEVHKQTPRLAAFSSFSRCHDGANIALDQKM